MIGACMKKQFVAISLGVALALTACTGAPDSGSETPNTPVESSAPPTAPQPSTGVKPAPSPVHELIRDVRCAADETGSWSFEGHLVNDQDNQRTFTIAIAVTVGPEVKGHDLVVQEVPGKSEFHVTRNYFAQTQEADAVCEPVVSVEG